MLVIADGFRRPILLFLLWCHFLIFDKLTGIDPVQIWIALVPKGTGSVPQSMGKLNWSRSKRNWEIPISDQNRSAFSHLHYLCFHRLMFHLLKSQAIRDNQHTIWRYINFDCNHILFEVSFKYSWYKPRWFQSLKWNKILIHVFWNKVLTDEFFRD